MALTEPLDDVETRILGVLVEKEATTPENYPLSLNGLVSGCNQKSNRDPVVFFTEQTVQEALLRLRMHRIVREMHTAGARVVKFAHSAKDVLEVDAQELAILAELMLRGPQTHGELRGRIKRMAPVDSLAELAVILSKMDSRGLVCPLAPAAGSRAGRVGHLLGKDSGEAPIRPATLPSQLETSNVESEAPGPTTTIQVTAPASIPATSADHEATDALESRVTALEAEVARLSSRLDDLLH